MGILFGIIQSLLLLPMPLRILIELVIMTILMIPLMGLVKCGLGIVVKVLKLLNKLITMITRNLVCRIGKRSKNVYDWDEKMGELGGTIDHCLGDSVAWLKHCKTRQLIKNKKILCLLVIIYFLAIIPVFPLKNFIDEYYLDLFYSINKIFTTNEIYLGKKSEGYPPLIKWEQREKDSVEVILEIDSEQAKNVDAEERICVLLNKDIYVANIRETPELYGETLDTVSREDIIIYQMEYVYDGERYWLKVIVESKNNLSGWISSKVIEKSIIDSLKLQ
jgi:hypothetical protein